MEQIIDINYDWQYKPNFEESDLDVLTGKLHTVTFPHVGGVSLDKYKNNTEVSYYEKHIEIIKVEDEEENVFIEFEGIRGAIKLYINGLLAGERHSEYGRFVANITRFIRYNSFNKISLVATHKAGGAVYGLARIKRKAVAYIEDTYITTKNIFEQDKDVDVNVTISGLIEGMNIQAAIMDAKGNVVANAVSNPLRSLELNLNMTVKNAEFWDIDDPVLYKLHIFLQYEAHILDEVQIPFGFRETAFKTDGFYLNGRKLKLCGVSRGEGLQVGNYIPFPVLEEEDAVVIKRDLAMNMVRICKESLTLSFIRKCDEIGLLTFIEIPEWEAGESVLDEESVFTREITNFIKAYCNFTSLILWGVSNINDAYMEKSSQILRSLDPVHAIGGQTDEVDLIDVYTYKNYPSIEQLNTIADADKTAPNEEIPYLVLNYLDFQTKSFDSEMRRNEHALHHMRILDEVYESERISGIISENLIDYYEMTHLGARKKIHYSGLLDTERQLKLAGVAYGSQQAHIPVMEISSDLQGGETANGLIGGLYIYTNCESVKVFRNEVLVGEFFPDKENFQNLQHPPIYIDDYLGNVLSEVEGYSLKEEEYIKTILMAMATGNGKLSLALKSKMIFARFLNKIDDEVISQLYRKYILGEGWSEVCYRFEGYKEGEKVLTTTKGGYTPVRIIADTPRHHLYIEPYHDVTPIIIKAVDEYGNVEPYINDVVRIETTGAVEILGHTYQSLVGGRLIVYVKTKGDVGTGVVSIKSNELGEGQLIFQASRRE